VKPLDALDETHVIVARDQTLVRVVRRGWPGEKEQYVLLRKDRGAWVVRQKLVMLLRRN
jgi:hypothetical protein